MKGDKCIHDPCLLAILDQGHPLEGSQESTGLVLNTMMKITVVFAPPSSALAHATDLVYSASSYGKC